MHQRQSGFAAHRRKFRWPARQNKKGNLIPKRFLQHAVPLSGIPLLNSVGPCERDSRLRRAGWESEQSDSRDLIRKAKETMLGLFAFGESLL